MLGDEAKTMGFSPWIRPRPRHPKNTLVKESVRQTPTFSLEYGTFSVFL